MESFIVGFNRFDLFTMNPLSSVSTSLKAWDDLHDFSWKYRNTFRAFVAMGPLSPVVSRFPSPIGLLYLGSATGWAANPWTRNRAISTGWSAFNSQFFGCFCVGHLRLAIIHYNPFTHWSLILPFPIIGSLYHPILSHEEVKPNWSYNRFTHSMNCFPWIG